MALIVLLQITLGISFVWVLFNAFYLIGQLVNFQNRLVLLLLGFIYRILKIV